MKAPRGFTLVELLIYAGLTAMVMGLFGSILITILRVQGEQSSSSQVSSELSFIMTTIKRHIHETRDIFGFSNVHLGLTKGSGTHVTITYEPVSKAILIGDDSLPVVEKINSDRISIDSVLFEKLTDINNASSSVVRISITASASTTDPGRQDTRTLQATASPFLQSQ